MVERINYNEEGKAQICGVGDDTDKRHEDMLMDIDVYRLKKGQTQSFFYEEDEQAILLLKGKLLYEYEGKNSAATRADVFSALPSCLHTARRTDVMVTALENSEILTQRTKNSKKFESKFYAPDDCRKEKMGETQWEGSASREVLTVFDYSNAPYSNMVLGEVINKAGRWSSYVPHSHPQPEVYYYRFSHPQGFGASFLGDDVFRISDNSAAFIKGGLTHPQTSAPGYTMYYCWMIRHLDGNPWTDRDIDPNHAWLLKEK